MQVISTNNLYQTTVGEALNVQSQWSVAETQQASGLKASDFGSLGAGDSRETLNLSTDIAQASTWAAVAKTTGATTQAMFTAVGTMQQAVNKVAVLVSTSMSSPNNSDLLGQAEGIMGTLLTQVNQQVGGNYLFAGANTAIAPVNLSHYPTLTAQFNPDGSPVNDANGNQVFSYDASTADNSYYTGDNSIAKVQVNLQQTLSYGVTANNPAIEEAIRAVQQVIEAAQVSSTSAVTASSPNAVPTGGGGQVNINGQTYTLDGTQTLNQIAQSINATAKTYGSSVSASVVPDNQGQYHLRISNAQGTISFTDPGSDPTSPTPGDTSGFGFNDASPLPAGTLTDTLKNSLVLVNQSVADLGNLQQDISNVSNTLDNAQTTQTSFVTYLQTSLSNTKDVDTAQAAAQVQQYQTQLQASFLAVSTLTKLSLASML